MYCKHAKNIPNIVTEWQMYAVCPACQWYKAGKCHDKRRQSYEDPCEFELKGDPLATKFVLLSKVMSE